MSLKFQFASTLERKKRTVKSGCKIGWSRSRRQEWCYRWFLVSSHSLSWTSFILLRWLKYYIFVANLCKSFRVFASLRKDLGFFSTFSSWNDRQNIDASSITRQFFLHFTQRRTGSCFTQRTVLFLSLLSCAFFFLFESLDRTWKNSCLLHFLSLFFLSHLSFLSLPWSFFTVFVLFVLPFFILRHFSLPFFEWLLFIFFRECRVSFHSRFVFFVDLLLVSGNTSDAEGKRLVVDIIRSQVVLSLFCLLQLLFLGFETSQVTKETTKTSTKDCRNWEPCCVVVHMRVVLTVLEKKGHGITAS